MGSCSLVVTVFVIVQLARKILRILFARLGPCDHARGGRSEWEGQVLELAGGRAMKILNPFLRWKQRRFPPRQELK